LISLFIVRAVRRDPTFVRAPRSARHAHHDDTALADGLVRRARHRNTLYCVSYSLNGRTSAGMGAAIINVTISVVALSVIVHGVSARPLLSWYERHLTRHPPSA
jgi:hypothetical protein